MLQVTDGSAALATVAVKVLVVPGFSDTDAGETLTVICAVFTTVTVAVSVLLLSATLVAVTVTVCMVPGVVSTPVGEMEPAEVLQVTAPLVEPVTCAAKLCVWFTPRVRVFGDTATATV